MRRSLLTLAAVLIVGLAAAGSVRAVAPELMERAVLPTTSALPTCACTVPLSDGDQLVVGLANGEVVSFHESAGNVIPRILNLPGSGPIDDIVASRVGRAVGIANEFVLLAARGADLFSIGFSDMTIAGRVPLAAPSGRYRFAKATGHDHAMSGGDVTVSADHPALFDDDSAMCLSIDPRTLMPRVEPMLDGVPGLVVTALSDREVVVAGNRILECTAAGGVGTSIDERTDLADEPVRIVIGGIGDDRRTLELRVTDKDSVWVSRKVGAPGRIAVVASIEDTLVAMGGTVALTPSHDIGWVALVDPGGKIVAVSDHASPVTDIARVSEFIAVQGEGRNLSVYDMDLNPLWDHDSPVTDAVLLAGDFAGSASEGLAVVGTRMFQVGAADADSVRTCLHLPGFMAGATRVGGAYQLRRSFITFYVSNEDRLRRSLTEGTRAASDAFALGDISAATEHATNARAAAAVLGEHDDLVGLSSQLHEFVTFSGRRRSLLLSAFVLAALGLWAAIECSQRTTGLALSVVAVLLLVVGGVWTWKLLGNVGLNPALFAGGAIAALSIVRSHVLTKPKAPVPGAAIEDLIRALMEFLHGAGEGVPSDGVVDAARKSVTKVAYLAQEMADSMDDEERYAMLRERFRPRGEDFLDTTHPRVMHLLALARRTGFIVSEVEQMSSAAERMRAAIITILGGTSPDRAVIKQQLEAIREARDSLASAADRAWGVVQANPGCSLERSIKRILREKDDDLAAAGVKVDLRNDVPSQKDAVALWSFQLRFVFENFVTNSIRAMKDSRTHAITIETSTDGTMCTVRFSDTGCGMTEEHAAGIFRSKSEERDGGSGLPSSRALLQERGGNLVVERTVVGEGTTFLLTVPHWTPHRGEFDA